MTAAQQGDRARDRIVECARELFSAHSYADVSVKDIADAAGVSTSLVMKHGVSKERLFEMTLDFSVSGQSMFGGDFATLGRDAVRETLTAPVDAPYSMVRILCVAGGSDATLDAMGIRIRQDIVSRLEEQITAHAPDGSPSPQLRAQSAVALLIGLSFMRRVGDPDFDQHSFKQLEDYYSTLVQDIVEGRG
ncbi:TetR/AcrR family transcriptional regulator [Corynebacterium aquilae]|uniref:HTH tetR-type domain-containing protein n=1 Tax=Corynebacterium aquilae DSM 44791 TaxID=1431546 RepID=A0A1L7CHW4_9CORY|nr:TetR/AcrR family transcriptional regulator [Corynebacterium aquilae]APT85418.1 hypothetical protein CAQU_10570 [Corynebacterium aquilae DSM 44791]